MRSTIWFRIRLAIIAVAAVLALVVPTDQYNELRRFPTEGLILLAAFGAVILLFIPLGLLFVIGIQSVNPYSDAMWSKPTHDANPFRLRNPLLFFHFAAYVTLAVGVSLVLSSIWRGWFALAHGLLMLLGALMILAGVKLSTRVFRHKMSASPDERDVSM
jgi:hypothetical protein